MNIGKDLRLTEENINEFNIKNTYYKYKYFLTKEQNDEIRKAISFSERMNKWTEDCIYRYKKVIIKDITNRRISLCAQYPDKYKKEDDNYMKFQAIQLKETDERTKFKRENYIFLKMTHNIL